MEYRPDINGLRAVAVISVILFHAGFEIFQGGYIGVDVFFVISGYLITCIILDGLERNKFSLARFYERRARRILPALFFVILCCIPFAWMWMLPSQFNDFAQSVVSVCLFVSNILFWRESGYFSPSAEVKPLLHTWSLAVEAQYYLFFPLFLILFWRFGRRPLFFSIIAISAFSFMLSEWGWRNSPSANFYLLPSRFWELLFGSICAFIKIRSLHSGRNCFSAIGLLAILLSIFYYGDSTPFPSVYTIAPVLGTALIIIYGSSRTWTARLLTTSPLVHVGVISYSAYLWHKPLFAFAHIRCSEKPEHWLMLVLSAASLVLAHVSWRFIEEPFRRKQRPVLKTRRAVFGVSAAVAVAFILLGTLGAYSGVNYYRFSNGVSEALFRTPKFRKWLSEYDAIRCFIDTDEKYDKLMSNQCLEGAGDNPILLFGDSHAAHLIAGLHSFVQHSNYTGLIQYTGASCRPYTWTENSLRCDSFYKSMIEKIHSTKAKRVVISANWLNSYREIGEHAFVNAVSGSVREFLDNNIKVTLVAQSPTFTAENWLKYVILENRVPDILLSEAQDIGSLNDELSKIAVDFGVEYFDPSDFLCVLKSRQCKTIEEGRFVFADTGHLSVFGSQLIVNAMINANVLY